MTRSLPGTNGKSRLLIYIRDSLHATVGQMTPMEIWLTVRFSTSTLTIVGVYRQWRDNEQAALDNFYKNCSAAMKTSKILILGDFNLDVTRTGDCGYSRATMASNFTERMESMGYLFAGPDTPTYFSHGTYNGNKRTSTIDLVYARGLAPCVSVLNFAATDHRPVLASIPITKTSSSVSNMHNVRNLRKLSSAAFCNAIEAYLPVDLYQMTNVDAAHTALVTAITRALDELAPLKRAKPKQSNGFKLSLAPDTLSTMKQRDTISPTHPQFRELRNKARKLVRRDAVHGAMKAIDAASNNPKKLWKFAREHMGYICPSLPASLSATDINLHFIEKVKKIQQGIPDANHDAGEPDTKTRTKFQFGFPSASKAREVIRSLRNTGAMGIDGIGVTALKLGADAIAAPLAHIIRLSFTQSKYPTGFKTAIVTPVFKGGGKNPKEASSYRPISILPAMSKVIELLVMEPLASHLSQLLPNSQFGFRPKRSTVAAIAAAHGAWSKAKALGKTIAVAAYDMSSAFDTIDVNLLCTRLGELGINGKCNDWFRSYLTNRLQKVSAHGAVSESLPVSHGVPQGSILGPLLFLTMMANLPDFVAIGENNGGMIGYADDICCWVTANDDAEVRSELERISSRLLEYAAIHKLAINESKTQVMWIRTTSGPSVTVGSTQIVDSDSVTLLGVSFDKRLRSTPYLKTQVSATRRIGGAVASLAKHLPCPIVARIARALVIGKSGYAMAAAITPRLKESDPASSDVASVQVAINNVARSVTGTKRNDRLSVATLLKKSSLPSLNRLAVRSLALETWKAIRIRDGPGGQPNPLGRLIGDPGRGSRFTRTVAAGHLAPPLRCAMPTFVWHSYVLWNSYSCLRDATTLPAAKRAADTISGLVPL